MVNSIKSNTGKKLLVAFFLVLLLAVIANLNYIKQGASFLFGITVDQTIDLVRERESFTILLLGIAGGNHDGPNLTDTIILASVHPDQNRINLFSIPRDAWSPQLFDKVNTAYAYGEKKDGRGIELVKTVVKSMTGKEIDYTVVINFDAFTKLIDDLGGIEINVERQFIDEEYPISGLEDDLCGKTQDELLSLATISSQLEAFPCRYKTISFNEGIQIMNGETSLEFVRSRHGTNEEGSDFARSRRQQQVISGIKDKSLSLGVILNPIKVLGIYNILQDNIDTDIETDKFDDFVKLFQKMKDANIQNYLVDAGDDKKERFGLFLNPPIDEKTDFKWVLVPRVGNGDFSEIKKYIKCIEDGGVCEITKIGIITPSEINDQEK